MAPAKHRGGSVGLDITYPSSSTVVYFARYTISYNRLCGLLSFASRIGYSNRLGVKNILQWPALRSRHIKPAGLGSRANCWSAALRLSTI